MLIVEVPGESVPVQMPVAAACAMARSLLASRDHLAARVVRSRWRGSKIVSYDFLYGVWRQRDGSIASSSQPAAVEGLSERFDLVKWQKDL